MRENWRWIDDDDKKQKQTPPQRGAGCNDTGTGKATTNNLVPCIVSGTVRVEGGY